MDDYGELLTMEEVIGEKMTTITLEDSVKVTGRQLPLAEIVAIDYTVNLTGVDVIKDRVILSGKLNLQVTYRTVAPDTAAQVSSTALTFSPVMEFPGAEPGMRARAKIKVTGLTGSVERAGRDSYSVNAVLSLAVKVSQIEELRLLVNLPPGDAGSADNQRVEELVALGEKEVTFYGRVSLPPGKPEIVEILDQEVLPSLVARQTAAGRIAVEGGIQLRILYLTGCAFSPVKSLYSLFPFKAELPFPGSGHGLRLRVEPVLLTISCHLIDTSTVGVELVLTLKTVAARPRELTAVTAAGTGVKKLLSVEVPIGFKERRETISAVIQLTADQPAVKRVITARVDRISLPEEDIVVMADRVILSGSIYAGVTYLGQDDHRREDREQEIKFRCLLPVIGARPEQRAVVKAFVERVTASGAPSGRGIALEASLMISAEVINNSRLQVILAP